MGIVVYSLYGWETGGGHGCLRGYRATLVAACLVFDIKMASIASPVAQILEKTVRGLRGPGSTSQTNAEFQGPSNLSPHTAPEDLILSPQKVRARENSPQDILGYFVPRRYGLVMLTLGLKPCIKGQKVLPKAFNSGIYRPSTM